MSWDAPTGARPASPSEQPSLPTTPSLPYLPEQPQPARIGPSVDVLGVVEPIIPDSSGSAPDQSPNAGVSTPTPNWKKRKKSKLRRLVTALVTIAVLVALGAGAVFGYQAMNPPEDPEPSIPLRDRPDTIFGKTGDLVDEINEGIPDQGLLDEVLGGDSANDDVEPDRD